MNYENTNICSHSEVLGLGEDADGDELKRAYRSKAKATHPDINHAGDDEFIQVSEAYNVLSKSVRVSEVTEPLTAAMPPGVSVEYVSRGIVSPVLRFR